MSSTYTRTNLIDMLRREIKDASASNFATSPDLDEIVDRALEFMSRDTDYLRMAKGVQHTAGNPDVDLGYKVLRVHGAWWEDVPLDVRHARQIKDAQWMLFGNSLASKPLIIFKFESRKHLRLWPVPSAAPPSTTLNGAITGTAVQDIAVADVGKFATDSGRALILAEGANSDEEIEWHTKDTTNNKLLACSRGVALTTAGAHATGATIQSLPLVVFFSYVHPVMAATGAWHFPDDFREPFLMKGAEFAHRARRRFAEARLYALEYDRLIGPFRLREPAMADEEIGFNDERSRISELGI